MTRADQAKITVIGAISYDEILASDTIFGPDGPGLNCKIVSRAHHLGGCGGNIAYGLVQHGLSPELISIAGKGDFKTYATNLSRLSIAADNILAVPYRSCARALIVTDPEGTQFTAFEPEPEITLGDWKSLLEHSNLRHNKILICAPFPQQRQLIALEYAAQVNPDCLKIWCPGQYADRLDANQLTSFAPHWDILICNAQEMENLQRLGTFDWRDKLCLVTDGPRPVRVRLPDQSQRTIPIPRIERAGEEDPTGCGDAMIAGFAAALLGHIEDGGTPKWINKLNAIVRNGIRNAQRCFASVGSQNYQHVEAVDRNIQES